MATIEEDLLKIAGVVACNRGHRDENEAALNRIRAALADVPKFRVGQRVRSTETGREFVIEKVNPCEYTVHDGPTFEAADLESLPSIRDAKDRRIRLMSWNTCQSRKGE